MPPTIEPPKLPGAKPSTPDAAIAATEKAVQDAKQANPEPFNDAFAELDRLAADVPPAPPKSEPKKESAQARPPQKPAQQSDTEKAPAQSADKDDSARGGDAKKDTSADTAAKQADKPAQQPERPIEKMAPKELRTAYENLKREHHKIRDEFEKLKATPPPDDTEKKTLLQTLEAERKRLADLQRELSFVDYTKDPEFTKTYQKPYEEAWSNAVADLEQLVVSEKTTDPDTGEEKVTESRKATVQDMISLSNMPLGEAWKKANEWFGPAAGSVMHHRNLIVDLHRKQSKALEDHKANAAEFQKQRQAQAAEQHARVVGLWKQEIEATTKRYPQWFAPDPEDPDGNAILEKGMAIADKMFTNGNLKPEEAVKLHAAIRNKAGAFDRMVHVTKKLRGRITELEQELEAYKKSEPKAGEGASEPASTEKPMSWEDEIDALASKGR